MTAGETGVRPKTNIRMKSANFKRRNAVVFMRQPPCDFRHAGSGIVGAGTPPRYASGRHGYTVEDARRVFRGCPAVRVTEIRMGGIERLAPAGVLAPAEILSEGSLFKGSWWTWSGSNRRPLPCHGSALPNCATGPRFATSLFS